MGTAKNAVYRSRTPPPQRTSNRSHYPPFHHSGPIQYLESAYYSAPIPHPPSSHHQPSSAPGMTLPPIANSEGRNQPASSSYGSHDADVYQIRAPPPGSYQDDDTGPSPKNLVMAVMAVKSAVNHFAKTLILDMNKYPEELKHLNRRIRDEVQGHVDRANHWKFLVQAFVCQRMFEGFEAKNGFFGIEQFDGQKMSWINSLADFTKFKDKAATILELFAKGSEDRSFLGRYCFKKFKAICADPVTNHPLAVYQKEWSWVEAEWHPQTEFYQSFLKVAVSVWLLHRLAHSFEQGWSMLGWETFRKGNKFSKKNMESVLPGLYEEDDEATGTDVDTVVGFLVIPGFQVSKSVVKCEVYLRNRSNLTDNDLMDGSEARLRESRARSYLKDAEESVEAVQKMSDLLKFNNEQCKYLRDKLSAVVQSASSVLKLSGRRPVGTTSSSGNTEFAETFELLMILGKRIESFLEGCCNDNWIQAAMVLTNVSEYVSSLGFTLELCKVAFGEDCAVSGFLTLDAVDGMTKSEVELVKEKASSDARRLIEKVTLALNSLPAEDRDLASYLLQRLLEINPIVSSENGTLLSNLFGWVESGGQLGSGGYATIYSAMWLGTRVAKKTFRGSENENFEKEVQILSRLCHPNITSMFCCAKDGRSRSIIMELMDGDLSQLMDKRCKDSCDSPPFPILEAVDIMLQIGEGVNYLYNQGIVHRDLKSKNILYMNVKVKNVEIGYVHVKVADFGMSKARDTNTTYTELTCNTGTGRWMAPEVIRLFSENEGVPSNAGLSPKYPFKVDSYSFGLVCYEILVGHEPFWKCEYPNEVKRRILNKERPRLPSKSSECPPMLKALIEKCWSHEPTERPTFGEICRELKYIKYLLLAGESVKHAVDESKGRPRDRSLEKSFVDKTPANYRTPPLEGPVDGSSGSLGSLRSSSDDGGHSSAENGETSSMYSSRSQSIDRRDRSLEKAFIGKTLANSQTSANNQTSSNYSFQTYYADLANSQTSANNQTSSNYSFQTYYADLANSQTSANNQTSSNYSFQTYYADLANSHTSANNQTSSNYLTPTYYTALANYQTPPPKSAMDKSPASRDSLSSSSNFSGHSTSRGAENAESASMYWSHSQKRENIAHGNSVRSKSGYLDSRGHSQARSHYWPDHSAPVASQHVVRPTKFVRQRKAVAAAALLTEEEPRRNNWTS